MIIAHPDDEIIWAGGAILQNLDWKWTIFSLCRADDPDRAPRFKKVCKVLNAKPIITDLDDESPEPLSKKSIKKLISDSLPNQRFDHLFTHGANGEYGHIRHVGVHEAVTDLFEEGKLRCEKLWYFSYIPGKETSMHDQETIVPVADQNSDWVLKLTEKEFENKQKIITDIYGFKPPIFETQAAGKIEAFKKHNK